MERLDRFMARANATYYATHNPYADFTTAPEIFQVFGELLGLWAAVVWGSMGRPEPVLLAEAGPGRGTLMADALRAIGRTAPAFRAALRLHLIETSPRLRAVQADRFPDATWHEHPADLPAGPLILLANEFLDALPIRQFVRRDEAWVERFVDEGKFVERPVEADASAPAVMPGEGWASTTFPAAAKTWMAGSGAQFAQRIGVPTSPAMMRNASGGHESKGKVIEICQAARDLATALGRRLAEQRGAALFLDYGPEASGLGDSLQAIRDGRPADPLGPPGEADLTAHVDFAALGAAARAAGAAVHGPLPQGVFLARLGLFQRTDRLARKEPPTRAAALIAAAQRLAEPMHMGRLFKAMAIAHPGLPIPPGFEPDA